jgi:hypothetical protein
VGVGKDDEAGFGRGCKVDCFHTDNRWAVLKGGRLAGKINRALSLIILTYEPDLNRKITFRNERIKLMVV